MNLNIKQNINTTEPSTSALIDLLYQLTKPDAATGQPAVNAVLVGRLQAPAAYEDAVSFLNTQFSSSQDNGSDLQITVLNNNYYVRFEDEEVVRVLLLKGVMEEGEGLTVADASNKSIGSEWFSGNSIIQTFNELKYFKNTGNSNSFRNCPNLISVDLSLRKTIGLQEFQNCTNLSKFLGDSGQEGLLKIDNATSIGDNAFSRCQGLIIADLSQSSITGLGRNFKECHNLEKVILPLSCVSFWNDTFERDENLTTVNISQATSISAWAFDGCSKLEFFDGDGSTAGNLNLPYLTGTLGDGAFKGCSKLTSVTSLGSITSIGGSAFENCTLLSTITFPGSINSVGENAFNNTAWLNNQNNTVIYIDNVLYKCKGTISSSLVVPNNILQIVANAFRDITSLESLRIGSGVNSIGVGDGIFRGCTNLETVVVDSNNVKYDSRDNCNAIIKTATNTLIASCKATIIPNTVTSIASQVFRYSNITSITIPSSITSLPDYAFAESGLISVTLPNTITNIGKHVFWKCYSLSSINFEEGLVSIGQHAFQYTSLTNVVLPNSLTTIGNNVFYQIGELISVEIGTGIQSIGAGVFQGNPNLTSVVIKATAVPTLGSEAFYNTNNCPIYVPSGSVEAYKAAEGWSTYADRIQAIPT